MSKLFESPKIIRQKYEEKLFGEFATANNKANSILFCEFKRSAWLAFIDNTLDVGISVYAVHPDANKSDGDYRIFWLKIPTNRVLNFDPNTFAYCQIDSGTALWVHYDGLVAPTSGALAIVYAG